MVAMLLTDWLFHDSHQLFYRNPFGAVACRTEVEIRLAVDASRTVDEVLLRVWREGSGERIIKMSFDEPLDGKKVYHTIFVAPEQAGLVWYYFIVKSGSAVYYYGNNWQECGGVGEILRVPPPSYQLTVHQSGSKTPDWFKNTVVYQLFVDRFYNGNDEGKIFNLKPGSLIHSCWENDPIYIRERSTGGILAYDFFGGNLAGVSAKLPYLKELGIGVIYMNPVFESPSNHKYDTADYKNIDPMFGTNDIFRELCAKGKEMGISFFLDGVFSHTGSDSVYFNREGHYAEQGAYQSPDSPYYSWYRFSHYPDEYESWWGIGTLPNVDEMNLSYRDFILHSKNSVIKHWQRLGAKGWRLDVADELPDQFLRELRQIVKETDEDAVIIGEVWEDASRKVSYGETRGYFHGDELDSVTNYPFRRVVLDFFLGYRDSIAVKAAQLSMCENYPKENFYSNLNVLGSHDVPRILTLLGGHEPRPDGLYGQEMKRQLDSEERILAINRLKAASLWQMTFPGVPCVYYGDEAGLEGYTDPLNRRPYPWGREEKELIDWYKKIIALRNSYAVLRTGQWHPLAPHPDVYGYVRTFEQGIDAFGNAQEENVAVILLNRSLAATQVRIDLRPWCRGMLFDVLNYEAEVAVGDGQPTFVLRPLEGKLLLAKLNGPPKKCGALLHVTSLPSENGIGGLGDEAYRFADFLAEAGQNYWQILPTNPIGAGNSPYQSVSAFACEPALIDVDFLVTDGLADLKDVASAKAEYCLETVGDKTNFAVAKTYKERVMRTAFKNFDAGKRDEHFDTFLSNNSYWLNDYALFMALGKHFSTIEWCNWPEKVANREEAALESYRELLAEEVDYHIFTQYIFSRQWGKLKSYTNSKGIKIIGDLPIFVAYSSADVWAHRSLFKLDETGTPTVVAGVPPDYFSKTGQLWGNPLYNWARMADDDFRWWRERFSTILRLVDVVRLDHFRGFEAAWEVPEGEKTAETGEWVKGPEELIFAVLEKYLGKLPIIAEDLGIITSEVTAIRKKFAFPGMKVLHFLFECDHNGEPRPLWCEPDTVVYTGTHDNNTTVGWYEKLIKDGGADCVDKYLGEHDTRNIAWRLVELAYRCRSDIAIIPIQDFLGLDASARMNLPGTPEGNWDWRLKSGVLTSSLAADILALARKYKRGNMVIQN
ncbi:MAG: 4-alpha-glucanotransferase [Firmicutes bacterium]|nr:4-alpha-glucanotransferase [Bacillota bacterium]